MRPAYSDHKLFTGIHTAGIYKLQVIAKEWLQDPLVIDFNTGKITTAAVLIFGKTWLTIELTPESYDFDEKMKTGKPGSYFETTISGTSNSIDATLLQQMETLRYHEIIAIVFERDKRKRIVGDQTTGMSYQFYPKLKNSSGGQQQISIDLIIQTARTAPFYEV